MRPNRPRTWRAALLAVLLLPAPAAAQTAAAPAADTPRAAMRAYLEACRDADFARAAELLDRSALPEADGATLARRLKVVLDQKLWIDLDDLSDQPGGDPDDGRAGADRVGVIETPAQPVEIWLERSPASGQWRIADQTVARIPQLWDLYGLGPLGDWLPAEMFEDLGYLKLWQWLALPLLVLLAYLLASLLTALLLRAAQRLTARTRTDVDDEVMRAASGPLTALLLLGVFLLGTAPLGLAEPVRVFLGQAATALAVVLVTWLAMRLIDVMAHTLELRLSERGDTTAITVIPVGRRVAKVFLLVIAALAALQNLGFNVLSIVAGLGVVGIAVAFASQKTFENFFGALAILADQPVRIGDFCRFGDQIGTIEDIGLRSTRVRTLDRTLITVPNSEFSSFQLENFAARDRIRFHAILGLRYETSADQLRHALIALKGLLASHSRVLPDPARVRFVGFGAYSLDLEVFAYVDTADWNEFLAIREDLMLRIIDVVEASGTGFAFPSQTLYVGQDTGLDEERARQAEADVEEQRQRSALCLPEYPPQRLRELEKTLPWPPEGAATS